MFKVFETTLAGRPFIVETGKMAGLSNGSCLVRYGETAVLVNVTASAKPREGIDFFPLNVDFEERLYSVGKIPGSFMKREGKPTDKAILTSRLIDRPMRPLFPKDLRNDVSIVATVMSVEQDNSPEIAAMNGAALAVAISDIPFNGPIGAVNMGICDGEFVINPTSAQREISTLNLTVAASREKIVMIEAGAKEVSEEDMLKAIEIAHEEIKKMCDFIDMIAKEIGKEKFSYESIDVNHDLFDDVELKFSEDVKKALVIIEKSERDKAIQAITDAAVEEFKEKYEEIIDAEIGEVMYKLQKKIVRAWLKDERKRVDGRGMDEIRPLSAEVDLLPRPHGSGMFTRGQTQVLSIVTLGLLSDVQKLDGIDEEESKRYIHHYNFPSYSVGETKPSRGPGRREVGHGALAERALEPVIPSEDVFPYSIRVVSEVLSSNGSTSQGSICGSTLALMAAGVPITAPVAGISCGLITDDNGFATMVDIQGLEDFYGDMDFKVGGTKKGITAIQVDIKVDGLTMEIIKEALEKTKNARYYILDEVMLKAIPEVRPELSKYAPKIMTMQIDVDKIRDVIGSGGKVIQKIIADTGVKIDIEDDGRVFIAANDAEAGNKAVKIIEGIVKEIEVGEVYTGKVTRIMDFGAFVEVLPNKEGLCHISKLDFKRVNKVTDVVNVGDEIVVKVVEIDKMGRINLSRKDALPRPEKEETVSE
ncbi:MAG: polyribonucleotide nucleotidyltransferase [Clostridia bacterium]|nr:polyribonucleotide nucleotidyltransferase [Oscillospiraceae bacterium]MBR4892484.1 polyribonucleotide nucleotidyltransferase [Clostridia bacterium]